MDNSETQDILNKYENVDPSRHGLEMDVHQCAELHKLLQGTSFRFQLMDAAIKKVQTLK